jgi:hypothetical protein
VRAGQIEAVATLKTMQTHAAKCRRWKLLRQCHNPVVLASALLLARAAEGQLAPPSQAGATNTAAATATSATDSTLSYRAYPLQNLNAATARQRLGQVLEAAPGLDVVIDDQRNRVLVRGNAQTHQLVAQVLANIDRPATDLPTLAAPNVEPKIAAYPLNDATRGVFAAWQQQVGGRQDVRVAIDERTSQVLVYAPPAVHEQINQQMAQAAKPAGVPLASPMQNGAAGQPTLAVSPPAAPQAVEQATNRLSAPAGTVMVQLRNLPAADECQQPHWPGPYRWSTAASSSVAERRRSDRYSADAERRDAIGGHEAGEPRARAEGAPGVANQHRRDSRDGCIANRNDAA